MAIQRKQIGRFAILIACLGWIAAIAPVDAQEETSVLVEEPAQPTKQTQPAVELPPLPPPEKPTAEPTVKKQTGATAKRPFMRPAVPKIGAPARGELTAEPIPAPAGPAGPASSTEIVVRPAPPIVYDTDSDARQMYRSGQVELVMQTQNPGDGCIYEIPLCIPACCTGQPIVSGGRGIFGRGVVEYCWPCGFRAVVKFRHVLGDVRVDYEGD